MYSFYRSFLFSSLALFSLLNIVQGGEVVCSDYNVCLNCTMNGCNWCNTYGNQTAFCTSEPNATAAGCTQFGTDQRDVFITSVTQCYGAGGCSTAQSCSHCASYYGCGYCQTGSSVGCFATVNGTVPNCEVYMIGNCVLPCNARGYCQGCTEGPTFECVWCPKNPSLYDSGTCLSLSNISSSSCWNNTNQCPAIPSPNSKGISMNVSLSVALNSILGLSALLSLINK